MMSKPVSPLMTDLYEYTMAAAYFEKNISAPATFSLFIRELPENWGYFVVAGVSDAIEGILNMRFNNEELKYLKSLSLFSDDFLDYLRGFRFSGEVFSVSDGTILFPNEPIMEVTAPVAEAQIIETFLLNAVGFSTLVATKAARCVEASDGRTLIDFSFRRTQGIDAALKVAKNSFLSGFSATSNMKAGMLYNIPVSGTMAHSFVQAFEKEEDAFAAYASVFPDNSIFLIDTYDSIKGAEKAAVVAGKMKEKGLKCIGVRLDSGDMVELSRAVREVLDGFGLSDLKIIASSGFDEYKIDSVLSSGASIDAFGVGTRLGVCSDAPFLDIVYKMVCFGDREVRKLSPGKVTIPGKKQIRRIYDDDGCLKEDIITKRTSGIKDGRPLLAPLMVAGKRNFEPLSLENQKKQFSMCRAELPGIYKRILAPGSYPVRAAFS